ncbi:hypothetical protein K3495_g10273 [Podosphaera aphanis]|nr:hypothetical protein K3495_g10273 [Podosphaera aphanis]
MTIRVPGSDTDTDTDSSSSFLSFLDMSLPQARNQDDSMGENAPQEAGSTIGPLELRELLQMLEERRNQAAAPDRIYPLRQARRDASLPKWSGQLIDLPFFFGRLETRIEIDFAPYIDDRSICLDMIETLPDNLKSRVSTWFESRRVSGRFDWKEFIEHFRSIFADRQASQTASEILNQMEQGENQYFADSLQDFEYRLAQSGGDEAYTPLGKTQQLKASINGKLRRALIGLKLPDARKFSEWVTEVKEVALELESLVDYRPRGVTQTTTRLGAPKSGVAPIRTQVQQNQLGIDADGDVRMGGTNAILAALQQLNTQRNTPRSSQGQGQGPPNHQEPSTGRDEDSGNLPRAPWRTREELKRLMEAGLCVRCARGGHIARPCTVFRRAKKPNVSVNALDSEGQDAGEIDSENGNS